MDVTLFTKFLQILYFCFVSGKSGSNSGGSPKSLIGVESEGEDAKSVESPGPKVSGLLETLQKKMLGHLSSDY